MTTRRAVLLMLCVLLISSWSLAGQAPAAAAVSAADGELLKWGITQGGLTLVCVLLIIHEIKRSGALANALERATAALASQAETERQQASAFEGLAKSVDRCEALRRLIRDEAES